MTPEQTDIIYNGKQGRAWIWDIAIDKTDNYPVLVYARFPTLTFQDHRYHYVKRTSKGKFQQFPVSFPSTSAEPAIFRYISDPLPDHFRSTSSPHPVHFRSTSGPFPVLVNFHFTFISLPFHFHFTSISLPAHFQSTSGQLLIKFLSNSGQHPAYWWISNSPIILCTIQKTVLPASTTQIARKLIRFQFHRYITHLHCLIIGWDICIQISYHFCYV